MAVDWADPCARAAALSNAYYRLLSGEQEVRIRTRSGDGEQEVQFQSASAETMRRLKEEMQNAQSLCDQQTGTGRPKRFAITAGFVPRGPRG